MTMHLVAIAIFGLLVAAPPLSLAQEQHLRAAASSLEDPCDFACPAFSSRLPSLTCYQSFDDCVCQQGFIKSRNNDECAPTPTTATFPIRYQRLRGVAVAAALPRVQQERTSAEDHHQQQRVERGPTKGQNIENHDTQLKTPITMEQPTPTEPSKDDENDLQLDQDVESYLHDEEMYGTQDILESSLIVE